MKTIDDVKIFNLRSFKEVDGVLVPIESGYDIPFKIKRVFYVFNVNNQNDRGKHSHHKTKQILICLNGEIDVIVDDGFKRKVITINDKFTGIFIPEMIWDEQIYKTEDSLLMVLCDTHYDIDDYIEDYDTFKKLKQ